jgi:hypothetical protein
MLYLIRTFGRSNKDRFLKVGFTDDIAKRFNTYKTQNPFFEPVSVRSGSEYDECLLHLYLYSKDLKARFLNEWFLDNDIVLKEFHASIDKIRKTVWKFREKLFTKNDFKSNNLKTRIYEDLRLAFGNKNNCKLGIDIEWKTIQNKLMIKKLKLDTKIK